MKRLFILILIQDTELVLIETDTRWVKHSTQSVTQQLSGNNFKYKQQEVILTLFGKHYTSAHDSGTEGSTFWFEYQEITRREEELPEPDPDLNSIIYNYTHL